MNTPNGFDGGRDRFASVVERHTGKWRVMVPIPGQLRGVEAHIGCSRFDCDSEHTAHQWARYITGNHFAFAVTVN